MALNITIVGAGIAGLAAARVLREYHTVTIVERHKINPSKPGSHEVGAGINLGPNAVGILTKLGFDPSRIDAISGSNIRTLDHHGNLTSDTDLSHLVSELEAVDKGTGWYFFHRGDLYSELFRLATATSAELGIGGEPATIFWDSEVVHVNSDTGDVVLKNGKTIASDLVIADGIRSPTRASLFRNWATEDPARLTPDASGISAFRMLLPAETILAIDPGFRAMDDSKPCVLEVGIAGDGSGLSFVRYPCQGYKLLNFVCLVPDEALGISKPEDFVGRDERGVVLDLFKDFDKTTVEIIRRAPSIAFWPLREQSPLPAYTSGRAVLIGDAAHAMTPHQGQGAAQGVEDAEGLSLLNPSSGMTVTRDSIASILAEWERLRLPRAVQVQRQTKAAQKREHQDLLNIQTRYLWDYRGIQDWKSRVNSTTL